MIQKIILTEPDSLSWRNLNLLPQSPYVKEDQCCVFGCKAEKTIRNFKSLWGKWKIKEDVKHRKVCSYHYNHDLKLFPREHSILTNPIIPNIYPLKEQSQVDKQLKIPVSERLSLKRKRKKYDREFGSLRKKPKRNNGFPPKCPNIYLGPKKNYNERCCLDGCNNYSSIRNFGSLKEFYEVKKEFEGLPKKKICNSCYIIDLQKFQEKNGMERKKKKKKERKKEKKKETLSKMDLLYIASLFV